MARAELGNKHTCVDCGVKFYDLNKLEIICPACGKKVTLTSDDQQVQLQAKETPVVDEIIQDETELKPEKESLDNNLEDGVIEDDNPIIMEFFLIYISSFIICLFNYINKDLKSTSPIIFGLEIIFFNF